MVGGSLRVLRLLPPLKTGRHDIAEILLKVALKHQKSMNLIFGNDDVIQLFHSNLLFKLFLTLCSHCLS
jgi:hypothetical protein